MVRWRRTSTTSHKREATMRLSEAIGTLSEGEVAGMARRIVANADEYPKATWPVSIENVLRGSGHVEQTIVAQRPPVLALLVLLTEADDYHLPHGQLRELALEQTAKWTAAVVAGELA